MQAGDLLGPYVLRREIGEGGIAQVFIAEHSGQKREVVVKVLRADLLSQPQTVEIFLREPRALQVVEHENTLEVLDVVGDGAHRYFVTELLRGRTLAEVLKLGPLELPRAMHIARQVAAVLAHAHDVDVVHRNLKPANIFLVKRDGNADFVKLLELGATRMQNQGDKPVPGTVIGTPAYMAPEQLRQSPGDHRVDMYSFGVLLYELAVGQRPFVGEVADIVRQHLLEPAPRASALSDVPDALEKLIAQCLEKEASKRPASMHEVSLVLGALAESMGPAGSVDDGSTSWVAVPKNTSGYTTVISNAVSAPPAVVAFEEDEPSFESVTGEVAAVLRAPRAPKGSTAPREIALPPLESAGAQRAPVASPTSTSASTSTSTSASPPSSLSSLSSASSPSRSSPSSASMAPTVSTAPAKPSRWPLIAAAAVGALVTLVVVSVGGDDATKPDAVDVANVAQKPDDTSTTKPPVDDAATKPPVDAASTQPPVNAASTTATTSTKPPAGGAKDIYPVVFSSTPAGAQVWIRMDKRIRLLCNTPCTFKLPAGKEVLVELKLDGYKSSQGTIVVGEGARFDATFKRR